MRGTEDQQFGFDVKVKLPGFAQRAFSTTSKLGEDIEFHGAFEAILEDFGKRPFVGFLAVSTALGVDLLCIFGDVCPMIIERVFATGNGCGY